MELLQGGTRFFYYEVATDNLFFTVMYIPL